MEELSWSGELIGERGFWSAGFGVGKYVVGDHTLSTFYFSLGRVRCFLSRFGVDLFRSVRTVSLE